MLTDGIVGAWVPAHGPTASTVLDFGPRSNHGTLQVTTAADAWQSTPEGGVLSMAGSAGERFNFNEYQLGDFCTSSWLYLDTITGGGSVVVGGPNSHYAPYITPTLLYWRAGGAYPTITHSLPTSEWVHIVSSRSGSTVSAYVNGQSIGTVTVSGTLKLSAIGNYDYSAPYAVRGDLGSQLIYDRALTESEAKLLYDLGPSADVLRVRRRRAYAFTAPVFKAAWATRATTIAGVLR